jgi:anti-sigma factor RsiW
MFQESGAMSRTDKDMGRPANFESDQGLWRRCRSIDMADDPGVRFLDLAAFADGLLDDEEYERMAAIFADDQAAAADVAVARTLLFNFDTTPAGLERVIARADALVPDGPAGQGGVLPFVAPPVRRRILQGVARWGSLAAAAIVASWLGFAMGSGASQRLSQPGQPSQISEDSLLPELLDPATGFLRDLGEGQQI